MTSRVVLTAHDRPRAPFGRKVAFRLTLEGDQPRQLSCSSVSVPKVSPINAYAGPFVRKGLETAQRLGVPFEDKTWRDAGSIE